MSEGFDAGSAAKRALGETAEVGEGVADIVEGSSDQEDGADPIPSGDDDRGDGGDGGGWLPASATDAARSLFLAPERGPSASTFSTHGVDASGSLILDGATDWLLDLVDVDNVGDSLGPAGKIGLGLSDLGPGRGDQESDGDQEASDDAGAGDVDVDVDGGDVV